LARETSPPIAAIRLGRYFGTDPRFVLNRQADARSLPGEKAHCYKENFPRTAGVKQRSEEPTIRDISSELSQLIARRVDFAEFQSSPHAKKYFSSVFPRIM